jgi:hypothetical protein
MFVVPIRSSLRPGLPEVMKPVRKSSEAFPNRR